MRFGQNKYIDTLIAAMMAVGYFYDRLESTDHYLRFFVIGGIISFDSWADVEEWLRGVILDDSVVSDTVEAIMKEVYDYE